MVELPKFEKCCFCLSLRTGSLVIGYASLIIATLSISGVSASLSRVINYVKKAKENDDPEHSIAEIQKVAIGLYISHAYFLLVFTYYFVLCLLLIVGIHRNQPKLLRYYFNGGALLLLLGLTLVVVTSVFMGFIASIPVLKWCVLFLFSMLVVRSTYLQMEEQAKPRGYEMQNLYGPPAPIVLQSVY